MEKTYLSLSSAVNGTNEYSDLFVEWKKNWVDHLSPFVQIEPVN